MLSFENDYAEGAHQKVLQRLIDTNLIQQPGYSNDDFCADAREKIRSACGCPEAQVFFLVGGTQANAVVIRTMLQQYEGVVSAVTGHVNCHEAGAIEYTGHKVLTLPQHSGKIDPAELDAYMKAFYADGSHEHMVFPGMVYISHPTEYGTLYTLAELEELSATCRSWNLPLFMDGARLGYGLMSYGTDVTLADIARLTDVFYIGGTKVGALCGEAVVFTHGNAPKYFMTTVKQHGAMLAKGRLLGVQFDALFTDGLYFEIARHAIDMAMKIKQGFLDRGYELFIDSPTNQQFIILENTELERISKSLRCCVWEPVDEKRTAVRFAASWATTPEMVDELMRVLDER